MVRHSKIGIHIDLFSKIIREIKVNYRKEDTDFCINDLFGCYDLKHIDIRSNSETKIENRFDTITSIIKLSDLRWTVFTIQIS
jgi:hypothetical protein